VAPPEPDAGGGVPAPSPAGRDPAGGGAGAGPSGPAARAGAMGVNQSPSCIFEGRLAAAPNQSSTRGAGP